MSQQHIVKYGESQISYTLDFAARKTLAISVAPDLAVQVIAPFGSDMSRIEELVRRRAPWILRQQRELERYLPSIPPRRYVNGETHRYLGRQYRLKVENDHAETVKLSRGWLTVSTAAPRDSNQIKHLVEQWYFLQAERVFPERLEAMLPRFFHFQLELPPLQIKNLKSRWGSCNHHGKIVLNLKLMQMPKPYIDYVIVHELCHLIEYNHSRRFYTLLDRMMPDWQERKTKLNQLASEL